MRNSRADSRNGNVFRLFIETQPFNDVSDISAVKVQERGWAIDLSQGVDGPPN